jgi:hypothetical protein
MEFRIAMSAASPPPFRNKLNNAGSPMFKSAYMLASITMASCLALWAVQSVAAETIKDPSKNRDCPKNRQVFISVDDHANTFCVSAHPEEQPSYHSSGSHPEIGATVCKDGSFSGAMNRQGACSHHGGIAR